jgi:hypothetical protein
MNTNVVAILYYLFTIVHLSVYKITETNKTDTCATYPLFLFTSDNKVL